MTTKYTFIKYNSIYDPDLTFYALQKDAWEKDIDGAKYIEVTTDFRGAQFVRVDSLRATQEIVVREY